MKRNECRKKERNQDVDFLFHCEHDFHISLLIIYTREKNRIYDEASELYIEETYNVSNHDF